MDVSSSIRVPRFRRLLAAFLAALTAGQPALVAAAGIAPAPGAGGPVMDAAGNGVPIVNIVAPDARGLSHNRYDAFSVDARGAILNNSAAITSTQLGGYIEANPALGNGAARLILNEVVGESRTTLAGYLEVAGTAADVVVANPHGMTCNGCGFINTPRATLTTGVPLLDGELTGYRVTGGDITVLGVGANTDNVDVFTLLARSVQLQAEIFADSFRVGTGSGDFDTDANLLARTTTDVGVPAFAIDSTALGGIHANRIRLVATEDGVGVRIAAPVAAQTGDLTLSVNGVLANSGLLMAENMHVSASTAVVNGAPDAAEPGIILATRLDIDTPLLDNRHGIVRTSSASGVLVDDGIGRLDNRGGTLWLDGDDQTLALEFDNRGGLIVHDGAGTLRIDRNGDLLNDGGEIGSGANLVLDVAGELHNDAGLLHGGRLLHLWLPELAALPEGTLSAGDWLHLQSDGDIRLTDTDYIASNNLRLTAPGNVSLVDSLVGADGHLEIVAGALSVDAQAGLFAGESLAAHVSGDIDNDGLLFAANDLLLDAAGHLRNGGSDAAAAIVAIGGDVTLFADGGLANNGSLIEAMAGNLALGSEERPIPVVENNRVGLDIDEQTRTEYGWTTGPEGNDRRFPADDWWLAHCFHRSGYCGDPYRIDADVAARNAEIRQENRARIADGLAPLPLIDYRAFDPADYAGVTAYLEANLAGVDSGPGGFGFGSGGAATYIYRSNHENRRFIRNTDNYLTGQLVDAGRYAGMLAGGNLSASVGEFTNTDSLVSSAGNLVIDAENAVRNVSTSVTETLRRIWEAQGYYCNSSGSCYWFDIVPEGHQAEETGTTVIAAVPAVIEAGGQLVISGGTVDNVGTFTDMGWQPSGLFPGSWPDSSPVAPTAPPDLYALPTNNPLFVIRDNPDHRYLVETNPLLATYAGFLGSDYLLGRLGLDPGGVTRRLGDGFYEMTLVREQLLALAGSRLLPHDFADEQAQYAWLLENGVYAAQQLQLSVGVALTAEQANALTADMVWLEERQVAGHTVLAPVVYLAPGSARLTTAGAVVAGGDVVIQTATVTNEGAITAAGDLLLLADGGILNQGGRLVAGGDLTAVSGADLVNTSGTLVSGGDMLLVSTAGNVVHQTASELREQDFAGGQSHDTWTGREATLQAGGNLDMSAAANVAIVGAAVSANGVALRAGNDVLVASLEQQAGGTWRNGDHIDDHVRQLSARVASSADILVQAEHDIVLMASGLAANADIALRAGHDVHILAAGERDYQYRHTEKENSHGHSYSTYESSRQTLAASSVVAGGSLSVDAGADVAIHASRLSAADDLNVRAGGSVEVTSGLNSTYEMSDAKRSGALSREVMRRDELYEETLATASLEAGGNLAVQSGGDQVYRAARLESGGSVALTSSDGELRFESLVAARQESHEHSEGDIGWQSSQGSGQVAGTVRQTEIVAAAQVAMEAARGIRIDVREIDEATVDQMIEAMVDANPDLGWLKKAQANGQVDWQRVREFHDSWQYDTQTMGEGLALAVAIVVAVVTGGTASGFVDAALQAAWTAAANTVVAGTINNGGNLGEAISSLDSQEAVNGLVVSSLSAGITSGFIDEHLSGSTNPALKMTKGYNLGTPAGVLGFTRHHAAQVLVESGLNTAAYGGDFSRHLEMSLEAHGNEILAAWAFKQAGDLSEYWEGSGGAGENALWMEGGIGRAGIHALTGGMVSELTGGEFATGAAAAGMNQLLHRPIVAAVSAEISPSDEQVFDVWRNSAAQLAGMLGAAAVGGDVSEGASVAKYADYYNRQLHRDEVRWIQANASAFARDASAREGRVVSVEEATARLTQQALKDVDLLWRILLVDGNDAAATSFLDRADARFVNEGGKQQEYFTAQNSQFFRPGLFADHAYAQGGFYRKYAAPAATRDFREGLFTESKELGLDVWGVVAGDPVRFAEGALSGYIDSVSGWLADPHGKFSSYASDTGNLVAENSAAAWNASQVDTMSYIYGRDVSNPLRVLSLASIAGAGLSAFDLAGTGSSIVGAARRGVAGVARPDTSPSSAPVADAPSAQVASNSARSESTAPSTSREHAAAAPASQTTAAATGDADGGTLVVADAAGVHENSLFGSQLPPDLDGYYLPWMAAEDAGEVWAEAVGELPLSDWISSTAAGDMVLVDKFLLTSMSNAGRIDDAREVLRPFVLSGDIPSIVSRLDVSSPKGRATFWSGNSLWASLYATSLGRVVLETTAGGRVVDGWDFLNLHLPWNRGGQLFWGTLSAKYAAGVSGDVLVVQTIDKAASTGVLDWAGGRTWQLYERGIVNDLLEDQVVTSVRYEILNDPSVPVARP